MGAGAGELGLDAVRRPPGPGMAAHFENLVTFAPCISDHMAGPAACCNTCDWHHPHTTADDASRLSPCARL